MSNAADDNSLHAPILGVICAAIAVLVLVFAAERSGLTILWSEWFVRVVLFLSLLSMIWFGRSAVERYFFGRAPSAFGQGGGLVLGVILFTASRLLPGANLPDLWLPHILGTLIGVLASHLLLRIHFRQTRESGAPLLSDSFSGVGFKIMRPLLGIALCLLGSFIALPSLGQALLDIAPALNATQGKALSYILLLSILAVALGGAKGTLTIVGMLALVAVGGILIAITIGLITFGSLPLPGFDNPSTLQAIFELKNNLGLTKILTLQQWPSVVSLLSIDGLTALIISALISGAIVLVIAPAIQVRRRRVAATAITTLIILPLMMIAIGSYAIEAVAEQILGTAINNPPNALLEATRLGLAKVCGAYPETAEALLVQCGVGPRDTAQINIARLQLQPSFLLGGLSVSLGYTSVISQTIQIFPFALTLAGVVIGIWFIALGLGRYVLGQHQDTPGLASHRIALTRISALIAAVFLALLSQFNLSLSPVFNAVMGGVSAAMIILIHVNALFSSMRAPRQSPQAA